MKKILFTTLLLTLICSNSFAQWSTNGSNIYYSSGPVGIGTSNPSRELAVIGSIHSSNILGNIDTNIGQQLERGSASLTTLRFDSDAWRIYSGGTGSSGELLRITESGNIGIGTPSPSNKLTVRASNALEGLRVESSLGKVAYLGNLGSASNIDRGLLELYDQGSSLIRFAAESTSVSYINAGNVGIGTTSPAEKLTVDGNILVFHPDNQYYNSPSTLTLLNNALVFKHQHGNKNAEIRGAISPGKHTTGLVFRTKSSYDTNLENRMIIHPDGNVGIGTTSPTEKLSVDGTILAKKVRVSVAGTDWPDYVFSPNFKLRSLDELEQFIQQNQHLPEVPSAKEVEANGLDLGDMEATLLKKIEELTLYVIEQNKRLENLETENKELKKEVAGLKKQD
ncbi:hypothetical protein [Roseivirga sp.]|uniref:hypothetical protein n=1 Tax=Roseivirga sp. TaxID=1964215 RepID=UPI003B527D6B